RKGRERTQALVLRFPQKALGLGGLAHASCDVAQHQWNDGVGVVEQGGRILVRAPLDPPPSLGEDALALVAGDAEAKAVGERPPARFAAELGGAFVVGSVTDQLAHALPMAKRRGDVVGSGPVRGG